MSYLLTREPVSPLPVLASNAGCISSTFSHFLPPHSLAARLPRVKYPLVGFLSRLPTVWRYIISFFFCLHTPRYIRTEHYIQDTWLTSNTICSVICFTPKTGAGRSDGDVANLSLKKCINNHKADLKKTKTKHYVIKEDTTPLQRDSKIPGYSIKRRARHHMTVCVKLITLLSNGNKTTVRLTLLHRDG